MKPKPAALMQPALRGALALSVLALALVATEASASTAANTTITNTATVNFRDAGGVAQTPVTASASVTVTLLPSAVVLSSPPDQTIAQGTSATLTYTITATANGPDTYDLASVATPSANIGGVTVTLPASVSLGGSTIAADAAAGANSILVPYDGVAGASVNGIAVGDTIVVGANAYVVASVTKNAGANTTTVGLTSALLADVTAGLVVGERATFTATVPSGTLTSGASGTQTVSTTATSATAPSEATTQTTPTVITVNRPTLAVTKTVSTDGGASFAATATAAPGTVLTYKVVASNTGATDATSVAFTDVIPAYLTYVTDSGKYATADTDYAGGTAVADGAAGYTYTAGTRTVAYDPGAPTGTVAGGAVLVLFYQATIN